MPDSASFAVVTGPGERRVVDLGSNRIEMNGGTRLILRKGDERFAALESGEAHFTIQHDPQQPFELEVGDDRIRDVGTAFDVVNDASGLRVAVSKGAVVFNPNAESVQLAAGQALRRAAGRQQAKVETVEPTEVGGWRAGRLSYRDAPLADVGQDIGRALGVTVTFDPSVAARPFTGVIHVEHDKPAMLRRLGLLLGLDVHGDAGRWTLSPHRRAAR
jgi:transmembrane sensor